MIDTGCMQLLGELFVAVSPGVSLVSVDTRVGVADGRVGGRGWLARIRVKGEPGVAVGVRAPLLSFGQVVIFAGHPQQSTNCSEIITSGGVDPETVFDLAPDVFGGLRGDRGLLTPGVSKLVLPDDLLRAGLVPPTIVEGELEGCFCGGLLGAHPGLQLTGPFGAHRAGLLELARAVAGELLADAGGGLHQRAHDPAHFLAGIGDLVVFSHGYSVSRYSVWAAVNAPSAAGSTGSAGMTNSGLAWPLRTEQPLNGPSGSNKMPMW